MAGRTAERATVHLGEIRLCRHNRAVARIVVSKLNAVLGIGRHGATGGMHFVIAVCLRVSVHIVWLRHSRFGFGVVLIETQAAVRKILKIQSSTPAERPTAPPRMAPSQAPGGPPIPTPIRAPALAPATVCWSLTFACRFFEYGAFLRPLAARALRAERTPLRRLHGTQAG